MNRALCLAILLTSPLWADEVADKTAVEAVISALNTLNTSPSRPELFTADFPNAPELRRFQTSLPALGEVPTGGGTVVISREPMGEATWIPPFPTTVVPRFITRSTTFISPGTAVVVATHESETVLFVLKHENSNWRIASFRALPEARMLPEARPQPLP